MLGRRKTATPEAPAPVVLDKPGGKGRPTPKRREAEATRKQRVKPAMDRREAARRTREEMRAARSRQREALATGDERYLPARDKGPVRAFARDYVDSRRTVAEFFLVIALVVLVGTLVPFSPEIKAGIFMAWTIALALIVVDSVVLGFRLRSALRKRFPDEERRGAVGYGLMRSTQLRRLRLPKPRVRPGARV